MGGKSSIRIKVKGSQLEDAKKSLTQFSPTLIDDELQISVEEPWEILTNISAELSTKHILTEKIEVVEPTLEDVFVNLTGRTLKEGEEA